MLYYDLLLFFIYSFIGWSIEVVREYKEKKRFINRGFMIGPICPIYGVGGILMYIYLGKYSSDPIVLFVMSIFLFSILEYGTSYVMEKIFKVRWWDYTKNKYNLNGRICAETMIPFGLLGIFCIYILNPLINKIIYNLYTAEGIKITALFLLIIFVIDYFISFSVMIGFKGTLTTIEKDGSEEISKRVHDVLLEKSYFYKRIARAYPNFIHKREYLKYRYEKAMEELKKLLK